MTTSTTNFIWRHTQPMKYALKYNCRVNTQLYVNLKHELIQGANPPEELTLTRFKKQMGYMCSLVIDIPTLFGTILDREDGLGFYYTPDKDFKGLDYLSYHFINIMGQVSEPECINIDVNFNKPIGRIEEIIIKKDTVILHNGNSDTFYESFTDIDNLHTRNFTGFNLLPEVSYIFAIIGRYWHVGDYFNCGRNHMCQYPSWSHNISHIVQIVTTTDNSELEDIVVKTPIDWDAISDPTLTGADAMRYHMERLLEDTGLHHDYGTNYYELGFKLMPIDNARLYAKDSNTLPIKIYRNEKYPPGSKLPGDPPYVNSILMEKIKNGNQPIVILNNNGRRKLLLLVNGRDVVALERKDINSNTRIISANAYRPNNYDLNTEITHTLADGSTIPINIATFIFNLCDIPRSPGGVAIIAHISVIENISSSAPLRFILQNPDGSYVISNIPSHYVLLKLFKSSETVTTSALFQKDFETVDATFIAKFTSNRAAFSSTSPILPSFIDQKIIPIDILNILGFIAIPVNDIGIIENPFALNSNYVATIKNSLLPYLGYEPKESPLTTAIYYGDSVHNVKPSAYVTTDMRSYNRTTFLSPHLLLSLSRINDLPYTLQFKIVELDTDIDTVEDINTYLLDNPTKLIDYSNLVTANNYSIFWEHTASDNERVSNAPQEEFPEIITAYFPTLADPDYTNTDIKLAILVSYADNGAVGKPSSVGLQILDPINNNFIFNTVVNFDRAEFNYDLYLGIANYSRSTNSLTFDIKLPSP